MTISYPSKFAMLANSGSSLEAAWYRLPAVWTKDPETYRKRIWELVKGYRQDRRSSGIVYKGKKIQTRISDLIPLITESKERSLGFKNGGAWLDKDNVPIELSNTEFLNLGAAIADYAEKIINVSQVFRKELQTMPLTDLDLIPVDDLDSMEAWLYDSIKWPSNIYDGPPRELKIEDSFLTPYVERIEWLETEIERLSKDPIPGEPPPGIDIDFSAKKAGKNFYVRIKIRNQTEAVQVMTRWAFVVDLNAMGSVTPYNCTVSRRRDGLWAIRPYSTVLGQGKHILLTVKVNSSSSAVTADLGGFTRL